MSNVMESRQNTKDSDDEQIVIESDIANQLHLHSYVNIMRFHVFNDKPKKELSQMFQILLQTKPSDEIKLRLANIINNKDFNAFTQFITQVNENNKKKDISKIMDIYFKHINSEPAYNVLSHLLEMDYDEDVEEEEPYLVMFSKLPLDVQAMDRRYRA
jgi:hypothetical protein